MLIWAAIEDAATQRLQAASESGKLGYRLAEVASYGGQLDDPAFFNTVRKFPAVWMVVGGEKPVRQLMGKKSLHQITLAVMVATRSVRGERQTRQGSVSEPGTYQLLEDVRQLLARQTLSLPISPLLPGNVRTLYNTRQGNEARSVYAIEFSTSYTYTPPDENETLEDLTTIGIQYFLTPADDVKDAEDVVTLAAST